MKRLMLVLAVLLLLVRPVSAQTALTGIVCPGAGCVIETVTSVGQYSVQIESAGYSGIIVFEKANSATWERWYLTPNGGGTAVSYTTGTGSGPAGTGIWTAATDGSTQIRIRFSTYYSGTATVTISFLENGAGDFKYILKEASAGLPNAQSLGLLTTGLVKNTVATALGTLSTAVAGTDYLAPTGSGAALTGIGADVQAALDLKQAVATAVTTSGSYANPSWLTSLAWSKLTGTPTTLTGYGITDAQPLDSDLTAIAALTTTSFGRSTLTWVDIAAGRAALSVTPGTDVQAYSASLTSLANLSPFAIGDLVYASGASAFSKRAAVASGSVLCSAGLTTAPVWCNNPAVTTLTTTGNVGIGTAAPSATLHTISTTEQVRTGYNTSNYLSRTVGSTAIVTDLIVGTGANYFLTSAKPAVTFSSYLGNTSTATSANGASQVIYASGENNTGDVWQRFVSKDGSASETNWSFGIDTSDSQAFVISNASTPGSSNALRITKTTGVFTFSGTTSATLSNAARNTFTLNGVVTGSDDNYADFAALNSTGAGGQISFRRATNNDATDMLFYTSATAGAITERMRINNVGDVTLQTTTSKLLIGITSTSSFNSSEIGVRNNVFYAAWNAASNNTVGLIKADGSDNIKIGGGPNSVLTRIYGSATEAMSVSSTVIDMLIGARVATDFFSTTTATATLGAGGRFKRAYLGGNTATSSQPVVDVEQTWNGGAVSFIGHTLTFFETASAAGSRYFQILGGASGVTDEFYVVKGGTAGAANFDASGTYRIGGATLLDVTGGDTVRIGASYTSKALTISAPAIKFAAIAFASLPTGAAGMHAYVTDSTTDVWGATVAGGGALKVFVWHNGTNWTVVGK